MPPIPEKVVEIISAFHSFRSATRMYMRSRSAANSEASSPPAPARISRKTLRLSSPLSLTISVSTSPPNVPAFPPSCTTSSRARWTAPCRRRNRPAPGHRAGAPNSFLNSPYFSSRGLSADNSLDSSRNFFAGAIGLAQAQLGADFGELLRGVFQGRKYLLTVPCIHTSS